MRKFVVSLIFLSLFVSACTSEKIVSKENGYTFLKSTAKEYQALFDYTNKKHFTIEIEEDAWKNFIDEHVNYYKKYNTYRYDGYVKVNMTYTDELGNNVSVEDVGLKTKGNLSRNIPPVVIDNLDSPDYYRLNPFHFKLKFNETFDLPKESEQYKYYKKRRYFDVTEINFKWNRNYDPTYISEIYSYHLFNEANVDAPLGSVALLTLKIGDKTYPNQVINMFEVVDEDFFMHRYGNDNANGNLYKCLWQQYGPANLRWPDRIKAFGIKDSELNYRPTYDLKTNKKDADFEDIKNLIKDITRLDGNAFNEYIESNFELDQFIRYLAMGVLINNPDDFRSNGNNYYLYFNDKTNKVQFIPYDFDHSLGQGWDGAPVFIDYGIKADIMKYPTVLNETNYLIFKILKNNDYLNQYIDYIDEFTSVENGIFNYISFAKFYDEINKDYGLDAKQAGFEMNLRNSYWYFSSRLNSVREQLEKY